MHICIHAYSSFMRAYMYLHNVCVCMRTMCVGTCVCQCVCVSPRVVRQYVCWCVYMRLRVYTVFACRCVDADVLFAYRCVQYLLSYTCHTRAIHMSYTCHTRVIHKHYLLSHARRHLWLKVVRHIYASHVWMRHVTYMRVMYECVMSHIWVDHVARMNGSCHTREQVMSNRNIPFHVTHIYESWPWRIHTWAMTHSYVWHDRKTSWHTCACTRAMISVAVGGISSINESCHSDEWAMSKYQCVISNIGMSLLFFPCNPLFFFNFLSLVCVYMRNCIWVARCMACRISTSHGTYMHASCHMTMSHVTHMSESRHM